MIRRFSDFFGKFEGVTFWGCSGLCEGVGEGFWKENCVKKIRGEKPLPKLSTTLSEIRLNSLFYDQGVYVPVHIIILPCV